jgi:hypothetical protein
MRASRWLTSDESNALIGDLRQNKWRDVLRQGFNADDIMYHRIYPLWAAMVCYGTEPPSQMLREIYAVQRFNVNATDDIGQNYLWHNEDWRWDQVLLQTLLDLGLDPCAKNGNGLTYLEYCDVKIDWCREDMCWAKMLMDYGCPFPTQYISISTRGELQAYSVRVTRRKQAARNASIALFAACRRRVGRDVARIMARLVWATRRGRNTWRPCE